MAVDPRLIAAIRQQPQYLQVPLLTTAIIESGGDPTRVGDNGHSYGAYQEYDQGRGAGLTPQQREDPLASTQRAAKEFQTFYDRGARGASLAFRAQRPADQSTYTANYNANIAKARQLLGMPDQPLQTPTRRARAAAQINTDPRQFIASSIIGRQQGQSLSQAITAGAVQARYAAANAADLAAEGTPAAPTTRAATSGGKGGPVAAAKQWLGTPYSWGGGTNAGPSKGIEQGANTTGFDCSSLVKYAWAKQGVDIPRTTYAQIDALPKISTDPAAWRPGDLIYPSRGHVQMYIGNGKAIEAPRTGGVVQIVDARPAQFARRPGG